MRRHNKGGAGLYALLILVGIVLGFLAGGEMMRRGFGWPGEAETVSGSEGGGGEGDRESGLSRVSQRLAVSRRNAIVAATRKAAPGVVGITVTQILVDRTYYSTDFFDLFLGPRFVPQLREVENLGSGFVIRGDGMILTNYHVVEGAEKLYVNFPDGREEEGTIVGVDESTDLAVVSVKGRDYETIQMAKGTPLIGEWAIAIGNPFLNFRDAHPSVTVGVVSALDRDFAPSEGTYYRGMIQTDAAINPGNSGGPLVNALGKAIGINTFVYTGSKRQGTFTGIGFAIPISRARRVAAELIKYGKRRAVWTGITVQDLTRQLALALGYTQTTGVVVVQVQKGSPGAKAGLKRGDIILRLGDQKIGSTTDVEGSFLDYFVGDRVEVEYRRGGKERTTELKLREYPLER